MSNLHRELQQFSDFLSQPHSCSLSEKHTIEIKFSHRYLTLLEEANLEKDSLFSNESNIQLIFQNLHRFGFNSININSICVASMGSSSTQIYSKDSLIGCSYLGSKEVEKNPSLIESWSQLMCSKINETIQYQPTLILCNSIGYFTNDTIHLNTIFNLEDFIPLMETLNEDNQGDKGVLTSSSESIIENRATALFLLSEVARSSNIQIFLLKQTSPKIENNWMNKMIRSLTLPSHILHSPSTPSIITHPLYIVDFGGGGYVLSFFDSSRQELLRIFKNRHFDQNTFLTQLSTLCLLPPSEQVLPSQEVRYNLIQLIGDHARSQNFDIVDCYIFQTGQARQVFYSGSSSPNTDLIQP